MDPAVSKCGQSAGYNVDEARTRRQADSRICAGQTRENIIVGGIVGGKYVLSGGEDKGL